MFFFTVHNEGNTSYFLGDVWERQQRGDYTTDFSSTQPLSRQFSTVSDQVLTVTPCLGGVEGDRRHPVGLSHSLWEDNTIR